MSKKKIAKILLMKKQREALKRMSEERIKCLQRFAEENVMTSRKMVGKYLPKTKSDISKENRKRMEQAYRHPFEKIPEEQL